MLTSEHSNLTTKRETPDFDKQFETLKQQWKEIEDKERNLGSSAAFSRATLAILNTTPESYTVKSASLDRSRLKI